MTADDEPDPEHEIRAIWENHPDEGYRRDYSHWRGVGRWTEDRWYALGQDTFQRVREMFGTAGRPVPSGGQAVVLEWGPGGGANAVAMAEWADLIYGIDVSQANLDECARVVAEVSESVLRPILLAGEPATATALIDRPADVLVSTAVFQHFPTKDYGRQVLEAVRPVMQTSGLGYVQIRYDDGTPKYRPKSLSEYRRSHITATSYGLAEFWQLLVETGYAPMKIANLNTRVNYASFYFAVA